MAEVGAVYLVGAGPGDPGLITTKGLRALRRADVVIYDRLVNLSILAEAPQAAELIYVGKGPTERDTLPQDEINRLLVEHAGCGKTVVRLKGGDPFLFGRGGEEADALAAAGVGFEIIPGVTSALAVPAYAGIPATDRRYASSVRIITGQRGEGAALAAEARAETVIVLMGVQTLSEVVRSLRDQGWPDDTPVALIENGTTARQRTIEATLSTTVEAASLARLAAPAVLVAGEVVEMRRRIAWFERRPLSAKRVVVLRGESRATELIGALEWAGAEVFHIPAVTFVAPLDWKSVNEVLPRVGDFRWAAFTSANGVDFFLRRLLDSQRDVRALGGVRIAAIGPSTASALRRYGLIHELMPDRFDSRSLGNAIGLAGQAGDTVLLPRGDLADDALPGALREHGLRPLPLVTYRTIDAPGLRDRAREAIERGVDAIVLTSPSTVHNLIHALGDAAERLRDLAIISAGPTTTRAAQSAGLVVSTEAAAHTASGIVDAIIATATKARDDDDR